MIRKAAQLTLLVCLGVSVGVSSAFAEESAALRCNETARNVRMSPKTVDKIDGMPEVPEEKLSLGDAMAGKTAKKKAKGESGSTSVTLALAGKIQSPGVYVDFSGMGGDAGETYLLPITESAFIACGDHTDGVFSRCLTGDIKRPGEAEPRKVYVTVDYKCDANGKSGAEFIQRTAVDVKKPLVSSNSAGDCGTLTVEGTKVDRVEFETQAKLRVSEFFSKHFGTSEKVCENVYPAQSANFGGGAKDEAKETADDYLAFLDACAGYSAVAKTMKQKDASKCPKYLEYAKTQKKVDPAPKEKAKQKSGDGNSDAAK